MRYFVKDFCSEKHNMYIASYEKDTLINAFINKATSLLTLPFLPFLEGEGVGGGGGVGLL